MRWIALAWLLFALPCATLAQPAAIPAPPPLAPRQAQQALEVLRDPARRAEMIAVLEALARARPPAPAAGAAVDDAGSTDSAPTATIPPSTTPPLTTPPLTTPPLTTSSPATPPRATPSATTAAPAPAPPPPAPASPAASAAPVVPDSLGAQVIVDISEFLERLSDDVVEAARSVTSFPLIVLWLVQLAGDPARQALLLETLWRLAVVLAGGLAAEFLVARLLRPLRDRLAARAPLPPPPSASPSPKLAADAVAAAMATLDTGHPAAPDPAAPDPAASRPAAARLAREVVQSDRILLHTRRLGQWLRRLPYGLMALVLDLLPLLALLAAGYALVGSGLGRQPTARLVILAALHAYAAYRVVNGLVAMLAAPLAPRLRLLPVTDDMAGYICLWARRAAAVGIFGYATVEAGLLFGLYRLAHAALIKFIVMVLAGFVVMIILQQRQAIAARIRPPEGSEGMAARLRAVIAPIWHVVAVVYVAALWVVLALEVPNGFSRLLRLSLSTAAVLLVARMVMILALGTLHRLLHRAGSAHASPTGLAGRLAFYQPLLRAMLRTAIGFATVLALVEVWGVPVLSWLLQAELGARLLRTLWSIAFTVALAVGVWEGANLAVERHLARLAASAQPARSARLRTLLPMLRTALLGTICVIVALIVLSEIGLNIAPLLAGAGVLGVAIGFGSQRLVQDVITGLFLLLENVMQVGDVVTLAGMSGTVENLSVRTIRLRALDGSMHIVPFSAVTTVTNMTRDYGYAVVDVSVGLNEDPEQIGDVLREVGAALRREDRWAPGISGDLEVLGIDRFIDNALVLRTRIRTTPGQRWAVGRELNRRIKQRFDELAIQSPMSAPRPTAPLTLDEGSG